jgi:hypothetical protein
LGASRPPSEYENGGQGRDERQGAAWLGRVAGLSSGIAGKRRPVRPDKSGNVELFLSESKFTIRSAPLPGSMAMAHRESAAGLRARPAAASYTLRYTPANLMAASSEG